MLLLDASGQVTLPPVKLFPAGTVLIEPVFPEYAYGNSRRPRLTMSIVTDKDDPTPWLKDLWASPVENSGASVARQKDLSPNARRSVYVPASVTMTLLLYDYLESPVAPLAIPDVVVGQGETRDLGRLELDSGVTVAVKVIDSAGKPVKGVRLNCMDDRYGHCGLIAPTNANGIAEAHVAPSSKGRFVLYYYGRSPEDRLEASVANSVAGPEDNGREFVLQLSDEFLQRVREARQERPPEAIPIQTLQRATPQRR